MARNENTPNALAKCQVLLVEDEAIIALDLHQTLQDAGCQIFTAPNVTDALAIITRTKIDAAVLDLKLGKETPFPIADALTAKHIPFMIVTGYSIDRVPKQFRLRPVLNKPFQPEDLLNMLDRVITPAQEDERHLMDETLTAFHPCETAKPPPPAEIYRMFPRTRCPLTADAGFYRRAELVAPEPKHGKG